MVKSLILCGIVLCASVMCTSNKPVFSPGDCGVSLTLETTSFYSADSLRITMRNNTQSEIETSDFSCLANTHIALRDSENNMIPINNKIKPNSDCRAVYIPIAPGQTKTLNYDYALETLYMIEPNHRYKIKITYEGVIKSNAKNYRCSGILFEGVVKILDRHS
jgi:hypothetical protein